MPRGRKTALKLYLTAEERDTLMAWQRSPTTPAGRARRGRIILLAAEGIPIYHIAQKVAITHRHVYKWIKRFLEHGVEGLDDKKGRGRRALLHDLLYDKDIMYRNGINAQHR